MIYVLYCYGRNKKIYNNSTSFPLLYASHNKEAVELYLANLMIAVKEYNVNIKLCKNELDYWLSQWDINNPKPKNWFKKIFFNYNKRLEKKQKEYCIAKDAICAKYNLHIDHDNLIYPDEDYRIIAVTSDLSIFT